MADQQPQHQSLDTNPSTPIPQHTKPKTLYEWIEYVNYDWARDSAAELRNSIMVVTTLFIAVAFQAGINPPPHIFPPRGEGSGSPSKNHIPMEQAGFLVFNTILLSSSAYILECVTASLPFKREFKAAIFSLMATYSYSVCTNLPWLYGFLISLIPFVVSASRWIPYFVRSKKSRTDEEIQLQQP